MGRRELFYSFVPSCLRAFTAKPSRRRVAVKLCTFHRLPLSLHFFERRVVDRAPLGVEIVFEGGEALGEFLVRPPQRGLGIDPQLAREVGDREEQVAHLLLRAGLAF